MKSNAIILHKMFHLLNSSIFFFTTLLPLILCISNSTERRDGTDVANKDEDIFGNITPPPPAPSKIDMYVDDWIRKILEVNETGGSPSDAVNGSRTPSVSKDYFYVGMKRMIKKYCFNISSEKACMQVVLKPHVNEEIPLKFRLFRTDTDSDSKIKHLGKKAFRKDYGARKHKKKYLKDDKYYKSRNAFDQFYKYLSKRKEKLQHSPNSPKNDSSIGNLKEHNSYDALGEPLAEHVSQNQKRILAYKTNTVKEVVEKSTPSVLERFEYRPAIEPSEQKIIYEPLKKENGEMDYNYVSKPERKIVEENEIKERSKRTIKKKKKKKGGKTKHKKKKATTPELDYNEEDEEDEDEDEEDEDEEDEDEDEEDEDEEDEDTDEEDEDEDEEDEDEEEEKEDEEKGKDKKNIKVVEGGDVEVVVPVFGKDSSEDDSHIYDQEDYGQVAQDPAAHNLHAAYGEDSSADDSSIHDQGDYSQVVHDPAVHNLHPHVPEEYEPGVDEPKVYQIGSNEPEVYMPEEYEPDAIGPDDVYDAVAYDTGGEFLAGQDEGVVSENIAQDWNRCRLPAPRKTSEVLCKVLSTTMICQLYCIHGHTFEEGITRRTVCELSKGTWSMKFEECLPFVDCTLKLKTAGYLKCTTNTVLTGPKCFVECQKYARNPSTEKRSYECDVTGRWNPPLPHCVEREGIDVVQPPANVSLIGMEYPQ